VPQSIRAIWANSTLALLDGCESMAELPRLWVQNGPPDALSMYLAGRAHTSTYGPCPERRRATAAVQAGRLAVQMLFRHRRLGPLAWVSDMDPRDLECLLEACGLPHAILLTSNGSVLDTVRRSRYRKLHPLVQLLALGPRVTTLDGLTTGR